MHLSRRASWFLLAFGGWSWFIWITFVRNLWKDSSGLAFEDGDPTGYFWVHLTLAVTSFLLGTTIGWLGLRGVRAGRRAGGASADAGAGAEEGTQADAGGDVREAAAGAGR
ncbi:hypothetical protein GCM10010400_53880 [Streptomyces aculeolatus]|uniref:SCO4848 family membrane protein n=1 Tax=Streptomyces aculeolatus TaxID=270689 RepID=UPI001CECEED4|nr:hypothetical protein [Streptomyces aculeolatus]